MKSFNCLKLFAIVWGVLVLVSGAFSVVMAAEPPATSSLVVKLVDGLSPNETGICHRPQRRGRSIVGPGSPAPCRDGPDKQPAPHPAELPVRSAGRTRRAEQDPEGGSDSRRSPVFPSVGTVQDRLGIRSTARTTPAGSAMVALLDTGVDASHPDLAGSVIAGTSILDGSNGQSDASGHGTWMAGIIAAQTGNGGRDRRRRATGGDLMPVTVLNASGIGQDSDIIAGIIWAADHGADVILMAFSNPDFSQNLQDAIDYAWAKGAVLVSATGNDGREYPHLPRRRPGGRRCLGN